MDQRIADDKTAQNTSIIKRITFTNYYGLLSVLEQWIYINRI